MRALFTADFNCFLKFVVEKKSICNCLVKLTEKQQMPELELGQ